MTKISFIYFDVGGVAIKDPMANEDGWLQMKKDFGLSPSLNQEFNVYYDRIELIVQAGRDLDSFLPEIEEKFHFKFPPGYSMLNDFISRFHKNESLWPIIKLAKSQSKIGLLTNMYPGMLSKIKEAGLLPEIEWDAIIDSSVEGTQKPEPRIYRIAEDRAQVRASEILFIDDRLKNLVTADQCGWQTYFYDSSNYEQSSADLAKFLGLSGK